MCFNKGNTSHGIYHQHDFSVVTTSCTVITAIANGLYIYFIYIYINFVFLIIYLCVCACICMYLYETPINKNVL